MTLVVRTGAMVDNTDGTYSFVNGVALDGDDSSQAFSFPPGTIAASLQAVGTFDSGTVALQCSNDGVTYAALPTAVSHTAAGAKSVAPADLGFKYYKVVVTGGGGTCALFGHVACRVRR